MIPRFTLSRGHTLCFDWGEAEGVSLTIEWLSFVFEIVLARVERVL